MSGFCPGRSDGKAIVSLKLQSNSRSLILFLAAQSALPALSIDSSLPALPAIGTTLGASAAAVQWTLSAFLLGFVASQLVLGPLSDRLGRRKVLIGGLILFTLAGIGCSLAPTIQFLIFLRFLQGIGACAGSVVSRAIVRDLFEGKVAAAKQSFLMAGSASAMLCGPAIGGLLSSTFGWRIAYGFLPLFGLLLLALTSLFLPETRQHAQGEETAGALRSYARFLREPRAIGFALFNALIFGGLFAYISGASPVVIGGFHVDPALFGLLFAVVALTLLAGSTFGAIAATRLPSGLLRRIGLLILAAALTGLFATIETGSLSVLFIGIGFYALGAGLLIPQAIAAAMAPRPEIAGAVSAAVGASQFAVGAMASAIVGLYRPGSVIGMLATMALFTAASIVVAIALERFAERSEKAPGV